MNEDFVTYDQAYQLKQLGFDWECNHMVSSPYDSNRVCFAPTLAQAQKWLRQVKDIHIEIKYISNPQYEPWIGKVVIIENYPEPNIITETDTCDTYEEALSEAIDKAIELIK